jgi:serine/threonine protein kinase
MGEVYEAQQLHPPRPVALKVLAPWLANDEQALQRFWRETEVLARLDHPNIVRIIATGKTEDGIAFYTMQLIQGLSLSALIARANFGPLGSTEAQPTVPKIDTPADEPVAFAVSPGTPEAPIERADPPMLNRYLQDPFQVTAHFGACASRALAYAHRLGILHRDIKPSNLMVDHHDQLYVVDFGLTRALTAEAGDTQPGRVRGTPWYMSPEQARGQDVDQRSDIYSLGVTLYELVTRGLGPYTASRHNAEAVMAEVRGGNALPLRTLAPEIPPGLERIIQRALRYSPRHRYQTAEELAADLEDQCQRPTAGSRTGKPRRDGLRLFRTAALGGAIVACAVLLGILVSAALSVLRPSQVSQKDDPPSEVADEPPWNVPQTLFREHPWMPLAPKPLVGSSDNTWQPSENQLSLFATPVETCALLGLSKIPAGRGFEFSMEMNQYPDPDPEKDQLGLFFGWHRDETDPNNQDRFFIVRLDQHPGPDGVNGCVRVGSAKLFPANRVLGRAEVNDWFSLFPGEKGIGALSERKAWNRVKVQALDDRITVSVDDAAVVRFNQNTLRDEVPQWGTGLEARGILGIWARKGVGFFRRGTITYLRSAKVTGK